MLTTARFLALPHTSLSSLSEYHAPLIGPEYQVEVGPFVSPPSIDPAVCTTTRHSPDGKPITINAYFAQTAQWNPHLKNLLADRRKSDALEKYLHNVETLFYKDARHVGHEVALRFLHQCEYDMPMANRMLKPWAPPGKTRARQCTSEEGVCCATG